MSDEKVWLDRITRWIAHRVGIVHTEDKQQRIVHAVRRRMHARGIRSWTNYWRLLLANQEEQQALIDLVTVTETCFNRHPALYRALAYEVLPQLHAHRPPGTPLRLWSAATATGEEAYTLAMALEESGVLAGRRALVLGTDINARALAVARRGLYPQQAARRLPSSWRDKHLQEMGPSTVAPRPSIRKLVYFAQFNLVDLARGAGPPLVPDVVICANVLIYFDETTVRRILRRLAEHMPSDGLLYVDEVFGPLAREAFEAVRVGRVILHRPRVEPSSQPVARSRPVSQPRGPQVEPSPPTRPAASPLDHAMELMRRGELAAAEKALEGLLQSDPLDCVAYFLLGRIYVARQEWEKARDAFRRAIYLNPSLAVAYLELGNVWQHIGSNRRAAEMFEKALRVLEKDPLSPKLGYPRALVRAAAARGLANARQEKTAP